MTISAKTICALIMFKLEAKICKEKFYIEDWEYLLKC